MKRFDDLNSTEFAKKLRANFVKDGFVFLPSFLNKKEIALVKNKISEFIENKVDNMNPKDVYYENINDKGSLKQLQKLYEFDPFFADMIFGSRFEKLASILLNDEVVGKNIQYFNKPPKIGKSTPPHQDGYYFMLDPNEAVTMWMALEPVDDKNGCVRYVKGSHKYGLRDHGPTNTLGFSQGISDYGRPNDIENEVFFPIREGDLLVHHSLTIHRADRNTSEDRSRKAMGLIYYAKIAKEDKLSHEDYAKKLAEDLKIKNKI